MDIREAALIEEMNKILRKKAKKNTEEPETPADEVPADLMLPENQVELDPYSAEAQERNIIRSLLLYGNEIISIKVENSPDPVPVRFSDFLTYELSQDALQFDNVLYSKMFGTYNDLLNQHDQVDGNQFLNNDDREISLAAVDIVFSPYQLSPNWHKNHILVTTERERLDQYADSSLASLREKKLSRKIADLQKELSECKSVEEEKLLLASINELKKRWRALNLKLGRVVVR
jgi:DNA primase